MGLFDIFIERNEETTTESQLEYWESMLEIHIDGVLSHISDRMWDKTSLLCFVDDWGACHNYMIHLGYDKYPLDSSYDLVIDSLGVLRIHKRKTCNCKGDENA